MGASWTATLIAECEALEDIDLDSIRDLDAGEATPLTSEVDALDSPLGADEIKAILDAVTVVAGSTAAIADLSRALIELVHKLRKPVDVVNNKATRSSLSLWIRLSR
jgi:hypothetical protein